MTPPPAPATVRFMATGPHPAPAAAAVRARHHIENVRQDAIAAAAQIAAEDGGPTSRLITDAISWALGAGDRAPFTQTFTPGGAGPEQLAAEIDACRGYLQSTPSTIANFDTTSAARAVLRLLEWLTGADDQPPTYQDTTQPGDLVGGRGLIVRPYLQIRHMIQEAQRQAGTGQSSRSRDWHQGVIATLRWTEGETPVPPMAHPDAWLCSHPDSAGDPTRAEIARERGAAEEQLQPGGHQHGSVPAAYADAVACTLRWLYGQTTTPPVTDSD
jgi:hypothetical protein